MSTQIPWVTRGQDPAKAPHLHDRHHPLLGRHVPSVIVPDYPDMLVYPGYKLNCVLPTHFRAYTRIGQDVLCDVGSTYEQSKYNLERFIENRV